ncbi:putative 2OG-Fe(II) oxygenase superfamily protein [Lyophyllum shimeji]|uniref:2OG-Fe(II) oxygenase superfamily protein n=1 Tax=Lyophyllum shimeji TaxID=47721 RepID=A0A9P3UKD1_LYOSH|nr:putative 2OG-Fe(II) oxygenase superfamily protein [Lyophyllum shimeji]
MPHVAALAPSVTTEPAKRKRDLDNTPGPNLGNLTCSPRKRRQLTLRINIPAASDLPEEVHDDADLASSPISGLSSPDSLFDEPTSLSPPTSSGLSSSSSSSTAGLTPALLTGPPIQGLFFTPTLLLSERTADSVIRYCLDTYFHTPCVNQVMLFGRFIAPPSPGGAEAPSTTGLPPILRELLLTLQEMLRPVLPPKTHALLFPSTPTRARQAILNLYQPGEGISPHVDLLGRFGDGIIGVSLGSGCVMQFAKARRAQEAKGAEGESEAWDVYLPQRSVIVLSEDARYGWTHGIGKHTRDYVALPDAGVGDTTAGRWIDRGVRLSITFRWLLPGADVVGEEASSP